MTEKVMVYARVLVPKYVRWREWVDRDSEYAPWVITHTEEAALENDALDIHFKDWQAKESLIYEDDASYNDDFSEFITYLEKAGYGALCVYTSGVWSPE